VSEADPAEPGERGGSRHVAKRVGLALAPLVFVVLWFAPLGLDRPAHRLAAVFGATVILWVTEALPIAATALLIAPMMVATGVCDAKTAFAPYADPLLFLFVGGFFIARAMARHGLDHRIASSLVGMKAVGGSPIRIRAAFMVTGALLSMWISNTATTAILVPILIGTFASGEKQSGSLLAVAYACSIGGLGTLVGSPPNGITARLLTDAGHPFDFVRWMMIGVPTAIVCVTLIFFMTRWLVPAGAVREELLDDDDDDVEEAPHEEAWSRGEKVVLISFGLAIVGWMVPGILKSAGTAIGATLSSALPGGVVALIAASVLFVLRDDRGELVLPWREANRIDWGIIMLFGGGLSLGQQMADTGLAGALARGFVGSTGITDLWTLTIVIAIGTIFFTEVCSNTASANILVPIVIAIAAEMDVSPLPPALAVGLAASCAFMLPIATGPNAIVYGSGKVTLPEMMKLGLGLNLACGLAIVLILWLLLPLYGWT
jgi:sodium-dependent dicarboxylate transporter 2/3/5